nr:hypothetical protein GCM10020092_052660 [Actinoplanes digitatis]
MSGCEKPSAYPKCSRLARQGVRLLLVHDADAAVHGADKVEQAQPLVPQPVLGVRVQGEQEMGLTRAEPGVPVARVALAGVAEPLGALPRRLAEGGRKTVERRAGQAESPEPGERHGDVERRRRYESRWVPPRGGHAVGEPGQQLARRRLGPRVQEEVGDVVEAVAVEDVSLYVVQLDRRWHHDIPKCSMKAA